MMLNISPPIWLLRKNTYHTIFPFVLEDGKDMNCEATLAPSALIKDQWILSACTFDNHQEDPDPLLPFTAINTKWDDIGTVFSNAEDMLVSTLKEKFGGTAAAF